MYGAVLPVYRSDKTKNEDEEDLIDMDNPENQKELEKLLKRHNN